MRTFSVLLLWAACAWGGIRLDNSNSSGSIAAGTLTGSITSFAVSSSSSILVVVVPFYSTPSKQVSTVSWMGSTTGWTKALRSNDGSHNVSVEIWYLLTPTPGNGTVSVTINGNDGSNPWGFGVYSLIGTTGAPYPAGGSYHTVGSGAGTISDSITVATSGDWMIDGFAGNSPTTPSTGVSQSNVMTPWNTSGSGNGWGMASLYQSAPAGPQAMSWTYGSGSTALSHAMVAIGQAQAKHPGGYSILMEDEQ